MKYAFNLILLLLVASCAEKPVNENEITLVFRGIAGLPGGKVEGISPEGDLIKQIVEKQMPGTTLKLTPIFAPEGEYFTKLALALRNDSSYDIISEDSFILQSDVAAGLLAPLPVDTWEDWANFDESGRTTGTINGKVYYVPWNTDARGIFFSKKLFAKAGLPLDWKPKNWEDLLNAIRKIKALGAEVDGSPILPFKASLSRLYGEATVMQTFLMLLYGTEDKLFEDGKWVVDSKGLRDTLAFIQTLRKEDLVLGNDILLTAGEGSYSLPIILAGNNGVRMDGTWMAGGFVNAGMTNWRDIYGFTHMPTQKGGVRPMITFQGGVGYSISANSKRKEKAFEIIKLITSKEVLTQIYPLGGYLSTRTDVAKLPEYQALGLNKEAAEMVNYGFYRPANVEYPAVSTEIQVMVEDILLGKTIDEVIITFARNIESIAGADKIIRKK